MPLIPDTLHVARSVPETRAANDMSTDLPFESFVPPDAGPIVVEVPHAGLTIDAAAARFTKIPPNAVQKNAVLADSDIGADLVWVGSEAQGIARVVARASRYVIDLNTEP